MDHPIPLHNEHPETSIHYDPDDLAKIFRSRCSQLENRSQFDGLLSHYILKRNEYLGIRRQSKYHLFSLDKTFWNRYFPDEEFGGSDPDPIYSRVFADYFTSEKKMREDMKSQDVDMYEQVILLTELSKLYNEKLVTARNLATAVSQKTAILQKGGDGKISTPEIENGDRSSFEFVEAPELAGDYEIVKGHESPEAADSVGAYELMDASSSVEKSEVEKQHTSFIDAFTKLDVEDNETSWVLVQHET
ncbi:hypothetical protein DID88_002097 [Monilinia fructigena]|uniref:Uncharacterized protein n=1 Tax=Monilinia fructigena TaxID=38457 RepID=A0A395IV75_9HELO|nr:hypothetical protein DID88_002097 [Monilinia fructigena]